MNAVWESPAKLYVCSNCQAQFLIGTKAKQTMYTPSYPDNEFPCPVCSAGEVGEPLEDWEVKS
jgi:DNA-directed RNA polymerase subunit RPC12/RpoP